MPSFDVVSETNLQEVENAVNQSVKEIGTRYDFKNSKCRIEHEKAVITITADDNYKLEQVDEILRSKLVRRQVDVRALDYGKIEGASGGLVRQVINVKQGVGQDLAKLLVKKVKESRIKVQAAIVGEQVRVTGKNRDDLQQIIALFKEEDFGQPLQFNNFRE
ncbi:MAG: YajQ family cyclic di-GMP-binding protein [Magnetococcales bacterium]|nr:YajQ family cyclic di-GMP-binding protein [Magnetococcales bacterium]NGZ25328.1 YajQ family cyclic di-GMP-binding protein [Magnetococcales bacterium]